MNTTITLAGLLAAALGTALTASAATLEIDKTKTCIQVTAKATGHEFTCTLGDYTITASGDESTLKPTALDLSWGFKDLKTADAKRDAEMLKWLGGGAPKGSYKFVKIWRRDGIDYAEGTLTINGVSKTVQIPLTVKKDGKLITTSGKTEIDYTHFGLPVVRAMLVMTVDPKLTVSFTVVGKVK